MSSPLAIAAVTETLRAILEKAYEGGTAVTTVPPIVVNQGGGVAGSRLNLFLYATAMNAGWRNDPIPSTTKPGETGYPPLAVNLYYLITPFDDGPSSDDHVVLGKAMRALHDNPVLDPALIQRAIPNNDLANQIERIRIVPQPLTIDEMSKLWTMFQAPYRVSAAYMATVVLIDSQRAPKTPLPVLSRSKDDRGPEALGNIQSPFPQLETIEYQTTLQFAARLGESFAVTGSRLNGTKATLNLRHPIRKVPAALVADPGGSSTRLNFTLPPDTEGAAKDWPAGNYVASAVIENGADTAPPTNDIALTLAPRFTITPPAQAVDGDGNATFQVHTRPPLFFGQGVYLLVGDRAIQPLSPFGPGSSDPPPPPVSDLTFVMPNAVPGKFFVRLRIDGADSLLVQPGVSPPAFDPSLQVVLS